MFQQFATLDLVSAGRAEVVVGRGSSIEAFPLFGYDLNDYDAFFAEKLDLLLNVRASEHVTWSGEFRPAFERAGCVSAAAAGSIADLAGGWRNPPLVRACGCARAAG